jgi:hypothetical protein
MRKISRDVIKEQGCKGRLLNIASQANLKSNILLKHNNKPKLLVSCCWSLVIGYLVQTLTYILYSKFIILYSTFFLTHPLAYSPLSPFFPFASFFFFLTHLTQLLNYSTLHSSLSTFNFQLST